MADGFTAILHCLRDHPDLPVADAEIMSPEAVELVTKVWPDGGPVADPDATAVALLRAACAGDSVVAVGTGGALTGAEVRDLARRITAALRGQGVGVGDRVGILLPRGALLLPAILGIWSAGASYVPMDPIYPPQRLATMLGDADAAAIVVDSSVEGAPVPPATAAPIPIVDLATLAGAGAGVAGSAEPVLDLPPSATAVTIFTSGSTGRPKAVSVTQGGIATLLNAVQPLLALGPGDRFVAVSTFAFDIALVELLAPVLAGGCVVVADAEQVRDAAQLRNLLADSGATAMQATPAGWRVLVDAGGIPDGVKLRMTAGEPLPRDLADTMGTGTGVRVWNLYGPTETTIYSGGDAVAPSPAPVEIGSVIAGTQLYLLDTGLRPVPPGVRGEVYIGGAGVAQGYHGAPGMTAGRFVPDPFCGRPGARLYRTGDVGRWRESGRIELVGRADRQIKIRGYRIESGEVEAALRSHDDVAQAVVSVRGGGYDVRLVGYLVTRSGAAGPPDGLREHLREILPDYMVPAGLRGAARAAAHRQREDRPPRTSRARLGRGLRSGPGRAADADRGAARGDLRRTARAAGAGRRERQLLRARRPFADRDPADGPHPGRLRRRPAHPHAVRRSHRRWPGRRAGRRQPDRQTRWARTAAAAGRSRRRAGRRCAADAVPGDRR